LAIFGELRKTMIQRELYKKIKAKLNKGKAIILIGPRQVGKTTLINTLLKDQDHLFLDGDDPTVRDLLEHANTASVKRIIGKKMLLFIDEAQRIANIGITLKLITDQFKTCQLIVSGSSSFELLDKTNEPLTGRKWEYHLYPISWKEWEDHIGFVLSEQELEQRLIYGMYPDVLNHPSEEKETLFNLAQSYLYKDIFSMGGIRKPEVLEKLLKALAYQIGNEVSYNELAQLVGVDKNTVIKYLDVLKKGYVIFSIGSFSRNLRNEIKNSQKFYFFDNGIRNAVIGNFNAITNRNDIGALWENFIIAERLKYIEYQHPLYRQYFWRTIDQQEIDYVEEQEGKIIAYELKWNPKAKFKTPSSFSKMYQTEVNKIDRRNFRDLLL
jgi:predicted AAA+ superfamily ATPase